jgi:hypothetical protein
MPITFPVPRPVELELETGPSSGLETYGVYNQVRGQETLTGRVRFGGPVIAPIDGTYHPENAELQAYLKAKAGSLRFVLALMSITFPFGVPPLVTASVEVSLRDDTKTGQTLAYSVFPANTTSAQDVSHGFALKPDLTILGTGGSIGEVTNSTVEHGTKAYLIGGPELSPCPAWRFRRTDAQDIEGTTGLVMVVQVPADRTGSLSVSLLASIEERFRFAKRQVPLDCADAASPAIITF